MGKGLSDWLLDADSLTVRADRQTDKESVSWTTRLVSLDVLVVVVCRNSWSATTHTHGQVMESA